MRRVLVRVFLLLLVVSGVVGFVVVFFLFIAGLWLRFQHLPLLEGELSLL